MKAKQIPGVPEQKKGGFHDTESQKDFNDSAIVFQKFAVLKKRFLAVHHWKEYCGEGFADFKLHDSSGNYVERIPEPGDFIRIDIPGPGNFEARGFDWVEIVEINEEFSDTETERLAVTCRPSKIPGNHKNHHTAHFYSSEATSTFIISRTGTSIKAAIYGRNESPNFNASFLDEIRNVSVALGGMMGISKIQWKRLSDGFLEF
ncbi:hypothetical protein M2347_003559 [Chryseobacterium sp. H1D6B]|uniref:hypothetical protein n=1 Tax=Chryseobacterium sp. H1D6B TaxID=2940588 RepID=UPI0015C86F97|nr:hypothetical protein [Chryseobacterium sp. H1D6B]MDH6253832.1 hypothetical protein [Chryseobacterium sp. H1D6B]